MYKCRFDRKLNVNTQVAVPAIYSIELLFEQQLIFMDWQYAKWKLASANATHAQIPTFRLPTIFTHSIGISSWQIVVWITDLSSQVIVRNCHKIQFKWGTARVVLNFIVTKANSEIVLPYHLLFSATFNPPHNNDVWHWVSVCVCGKTYSHHCTSGWAIKYTNSC